MPVMDGFTATANIRQFEKETGATPTPVLALTAHAFADAAEKAFAAGFTELLTKPIRKAALLDALSKYIARPSQSSLAPTPPSNSVLVEEGMEDVVPGYLEKRRAEIPAYNEALTNGNFETIRMMAHKTKGTGSGYGFPVLTELAAVIEKAAERRDAEQVRATTAELANYLSSIELKFNS
jgi:DNA-binding response OmpR family regulator